MNRGEPNPRDWKTLDRGVEELETELQRIRWQSAGKGLMQIETTLSDELARYLDLSTRQIQITAANMANIDTPGYRTVGMNFEAEMAAALATDGEDEVAPKIDEVGGLVVRPDGNDVSMDREGMQMAEAQLKFRTGVALMRREYTRIFDAIHAGK